MYAATEDDGVFRSTNNGVNWSAFNTGLEGIAGREERPHRLHQRHDGLRGHQRGPVQVRRAAAASSRSRRVLSRTRRTRRSSTGRAGGLHRHPARQPDARRRRQRRRLQVHRRRRDLAAAGAGQRDGALRRRVWSLGSFKDNGALIYAATQSGIYISTDFGSNWTLSNDGITGITLRAWADDKYPNIYYAGTTDGLFRSVNARPHLEPHQRGHDGPRDHAVQRHQDQAHLRRHRQRRHRRSDRPATRSRARPRGASSRPPGWRPTRRSGASTATSTRPARCSPARTVAAARRWSSRRRSGPASSRTIKPVTPAVGAKLEVGYQRHVDRHPDDRVHLPVAGLHRACADIKDATESSFVIPTQNRKYRVVVTAQNDFPLDEVGSAESKESDITAASGPKPGTLPGDDQTSTGSIKLTPAGQPQPGTILTAQNWLFNPARPRPPASSGSAAWASATATSSRAPPASTTRSSTRTSASTCAWR